MIRKKQMELDVALHLTVTVRTKTYQSCGTVVGGWEVMKWQMVNLPAAKQTVTVVGVFLKCQTSYLQENSNLNYQTVNIWCDWLTDVTSFLTVATCCSLAESKSAAIPCQNKSSTLCYDCMCEFANKRYRCSCPDQPAASGVLRTRMCLHL